MHPSVPTPPADPTRPAVKARPADGRAEAAAAPRVAFQGEPGAFSEEAVLAAFAASTPLAVPTWRSVFEAVRDGAVDAGVVAIENSLAGTIRETYDLLFEWYDAGIRVVGEVSVPVRLALLVPVTLAVVLIAVIFAGRERTIAGEMLTALTLV
ncbi:MAG: prephenate dehydratase domain-containing protein, partial [Candidatus Limnocylindrales bacterium]